MLGAEGCARMKEEGEKMWSRISTVEREIWGEEARRMVESGQPPTLLRGLDSPYHVNCGSGMRAWRTTYCLSDEFPGGNF